MKQRIVTAIIALAVFLPAVIYGRAPFTIFIYLLASIALYELLKMKRISIHSIPGLLSLLLLWVLLIPSNYINLLDEFSITKIEFALLGVLFFLCYTVVTKNRFSFDDVGFTIITTMYIGIGFFYFIEMRNIGLYPIVYALLIIWATDSGAYFIGKSAGKKKLWPEISPNKTIEGSIGGIFCAVIIAWIFQYFTAFADSYLSITLITVLLSIFGQIGDLAESALKRHYQVKDSGHILPGHGGILDRFDSMIFVLPIMHFLFLFFN
ncbi:phosphatidate cytidylyltransferase [Bacillus sp. CMF21]|uniref:phosphatidate cytidylyltransferase n=1 Tax=Metabacillus dongyingensis TaxID=2874282 RepID=UPI001CBEED40|nr:phosphatidate cytidylyltransferase [Metabacillus dongyingensis]UAL54287.1 phosphatidate cytidylyltransferase [Metabacillus dongyingensis]USK30607.1 phosphatidate cytidylyltransferase [Bacillus sp. CMF21]